VKTHKTEGRATFNDDGSWNPKFKCGLPLLRPEYVVGASLAEMYY
jgi:hypothetical protein